MIHFFISSIRGGTLEQVVNISLFRDCIVEYLRFYAINIIFQNCTNSVSYMASDTYSTVRLLNTNTVNKYQNPKGARTEQNRTEHEKWTYCHTDNCKGCRVYQQSAMQQTSANKTWHDQPMNTHSPSRFVHILAAVFSQQVQLNRWGETVDRKRKVSGEIWCMNLSKEQHWERMKVTEGKWMVTWAILQTMACPSSPHPLVYGSSTMKERMANNWILQHFIFLLHNTPQPPLLLFITVWERPNRFRHFSVWIVWIEFEHCCLRYVNLEYDFTVQIKWKERHIFYSWFYLELLSRFS